MTNIEVNFIVSFIRESGHYATLDKLESRADLHAQFFLHRYHFLAHGGHCVCKPRIQAIGQQRMSSNADISESRKEGITALSSALENSAGNVVIVTSQADGLTTNMEGFHTYFEKYHQKNISLFVIYNDTEFAMLKIRDLLQVITKVSRDGFPDMKTPMEEFVWTSVRGGLGKLKMGAGKADNHALGFHARNHKDLTVIPLVPKTQLPEILPPKKSSPAIFEFSSATVTNTKSVSKAPQNLRPGQSIGIVSMNEADKWQRSEDMLAKRKGSVVRVQLETVDGEFICPEKTCHATFPRIESLKDHILKKVLSQPSSRRSCIFCAHKLSTYHTNIKTHLFRHLPPNLQCQFPGCVVIKRTEADLKHHMSSHVPLEEREKKEGEMPCPHCPRLFTKNDHLKNHVETIHVDPTTVDCPQCGTSLKKESLPQHLVRNCKKREVILMTECEICQKVVAVGNYANHLRGQHQVRDMVQKFAVSTGVLSIAEVLPQDELAAAPLVQETSSLIKASSLSVETTIAPELYQNVASLRSPAKVLPPQKSATVAAWKELFRKPKK